MLGESLKNFKVIRKRLPSATRILNGHRNIRTGGKRESHGHPVIIISVYCRHIQLFWRSYHTVVRPFFNRCSQLNYFFKNC